MAAPAPVLFTYDAHRVEDSGRGAKTHVFTITGDNTDNSPFLTLRVDSAVSQQSLPFFRADGSPVKGVVALDVQKSKAIKSVDVFLRGIVVASAIDTRTFIELRQTLWNPSKGDPQYPGPPEQVESHGNSPSSSMQALQDVFESKTDLQGSYSWPFTFNIPSTVTYSEKEADGLSIGLTPGIAYPLPPTFDNSQGGAAIVYNLIVKVKSGSLFGSDTDLYTVVGYGNDPSQIYTPLGGTTEEKPTWKTFPETAIVGSLDKQLQIGVKCALSLPETLTYARGSDIPVRLTLGCSDPQVLELFANPGAPVVELHHKTKTPIGVASAPTTTLRSGKDWVLPDATAVWRETGAKFEKAGDTIRVLEGVLHVPLRIGPTFSFGDFHNTYAFEIYPSRVPKFEPLSGERLFRTNEPITIL